MSCILYIISLIINFVKIRRRINKKLEGVANSNKVMHYNVSASSLPLHQGRLLQGLNEHLLITIFTAVASLCGYILPVEVFLLHSFHGNTDLSLYGETMYYSTGFCNFKNCKKIQI